MIIRFLGAGGPTMKYLARVEEAAEKCRDRVVVVLLHSLSKRGEERECKDMLGLGYGG
jgi:hypothetical protein